MSLRWYRSQLYVVSRNRCIAILIDKANRQDAFWAKVQNLWERMTTWKPDSTAAQ